MAAPWNQLGAFEMLTPGPHPRDSDLIEDSSALDCGNSWVTAQACGVETALGGGGVEMGAGWGLSVGICRLLRLPGHPTLPFPRHRGSRTGL